MIMPGGPSMLDPYLVGKSAERLSDLTHECNRIADLLRALLDSVDSGDLQGTVNGPILELRELAFRLIDLLLSKASEMDDAANGGQGGPVCGTPDILIDILTGGKDGAEAGANGALVLSVARKLLFYILSKTKPAPIDIKDIEEVLSGAGTEDIKEMLEKLSDPILLPYPGEDGGVGSGGGGGTSGPYGGDEGGDGSVGSGGGGGSSGTGGGGGGGSGGGGGGTGSGGGGGDSGTWLGPNEGGGTIDQPVLEGEVIDEPLEPAEPNACCGATGACSCGTEVDGTIEGRVDEVLVSSEAFGYILKDGTLIIDGKPVPWPEGFPFPQEFPPPGGEPPLGPYDMGPYGPIQTDDWESRGFPGPDRWPYDPTERGTVYRPWGPMRPEDVTSDDVFRFLKHNLSREALLKIQPHTDYNLLD